ARTRLPRQRASVGEGAGRTTSTFMAYLILDLSLLGVWRVTAHSCVENKHGELVDITPTQASQDYRSYDTLARTRSFLPWRTPSSWMSPWGESPTIRSSWFPVGALGFVAGVANGHDQVGDNVVVDCNVGVCAHGILQDVRQHPRLRYRKAVSLV